MLRRFKRDAFLHLQYRSAQLQDEGPTIQLIVKGETALALGEAVRGYQTIIGALMASPSSYIYLEKTL
jgi:hypothetical protein